MYGIPTNSTTRSRCGKKRFVQKMSAVTKSTTHPDGNVLVLEAASSKRAGRWQFVRRTPCGRSYSTPSAAVGRHPLVALVRHPLRSLSFGRAASSGSAHFPFTLMNVLVTYVEIRLFHRRQTNSHNVFPVETRVQSI